LPPGPTAPFENRKTGLTIFGIMTLLFGVLCALFVPLLFVSLAMTPRTGAPARDLPQILPAVATYGGLAVVLIWLGIGSIKARRWARALLLVLSCSWLLIGIISTAVIAVAMPKIMAAQAAAPAGQPAPPPEAMSVIVGFTVAFIAVLMVILPAIWVWFYRSPHVKATCEAADPVERWTDRSPLPVIAVSLWLLFSVPSILFAPVAYKGVVPFFGNFLVGPVATAIYILMAALWTYGAWAMYKLRPLGWWLITVSIVVSGISGFLTYSRHSIGELYRLLDYPAEQIALIEKLNFLTGTGMAWMMVATLVPFLGYMLYLRKYFAQPAR
jgi:hypothetical protein